MNIDYHISAIGVDLGGTKVLAGQVQDNAVVGRHEEAVPKGGTVLEVLDVIYAVIDEVLDSDVAGIGIGVPSVVDIEKGIVYDVQNIPSWEEVHLKEILEDRYGLPVIVDNDANCFALGEKYFGKGRKYKDFIGLTVGTGMAAGIIIDHKLYHGSNCAAGEFGTIPYLDQCYEYYASGQFFSNVYNLSGKEVYKRALQGDAVALAMYGELGTHLGNAINTILYAIDPQVIILGGSVSHAYDFYEKNMWERIEKIAYRKIAERLTIEISDNPDLAVLGSAALYYDARTIGSDNTLKTETNKIL